MRKYSRERGRTENMQTQCFEDARQLCLRGCCPTPLPNVPEAKPRQSNTKSRSTTSACRHNFAATTTSSFFHDKRFTNHESLPPMQESFSQFMRAYPKYLETTQVDQIRAHDYYHLTFSNHICLDYIGIGLFSYSQIQKQHPAAPVGSPSSATAQQSNFPLFGVSYKSVDLKSELLHGGHGSELECAIKKRIMDFLNISDKDYCMVLTANRSSAFRLVSESYPFRSSRKLLTVYDYQSEAVEAMIHTSEMRGARVMSADFKWPRLRIQSAKLRNKVIRKNKNKKHRGLFVIPLQSRVTGASYSYQWMSLAQENGWHVLLDACALGPKDMDSFGLSLIRPDFLICSFYKVFGEDPTGFACLFVKKSTVPILEDSASTGIVSLVPPKKLLPFPEDSSGSDTELEQTSGLGTQIVGLAEPSTSPNPPVVQMRQNGGSELVDTTEMHKSQVAEELGPEIPGTSSDLVPQGTANLCLNGNAEAECRCLDHVDSLGLILVGSRARFLINWLVNALLKLEHPNAEDKVPLVRVYGPRIRFDRGPALAFNVYDWKGEKIQPLLIQKLADRNNISLSCAVLRQIWFSDKHGEEKEKFMDRRITEEKERAGGSSQKKTHQQATVVTLALGFLANFEDIFKLWAFIARFLDADFVEKERWRYTALNQKTVEI